MTRAIYVTLLLVLTPVYGVAAVWRVEKDGSGDFLQIQEAIEAAASGDTVAIGPGLWMKFSLFQASGTFEAIGFVQQEELTLRGAGVDETTLAYAFGPGTTDHPMGIVTSLDSSIRLERMTLSQTCAQVYKPMVPRSMWKDVGLFGTTWVSTAVPP